MLSVKGFYNGNSIELLEPIPSQKKAKVIITLLDDDLFDDLFCQSYLQMVESSLNDIWDNSNDEKVWSRYLDE